MNYFRELVQTSKEQLKYCLPLLYKRIFEMHPDIFKRKMSYIHLFLGCPIHFYSSYIFTILGVCMCVCVHLSFLVSVPVIYIVSYRLIFPFSSFFFLLLQAAGLNFRLAH